MLALSTHFRQMRRGRGFYRSPISLRFLVLVGLGAMVVIVFPLLSGCGSDSTPGGSVKMKNAPAATKSAATKMQMGSPMFVGERGADPGKMGLVQKQSYSEPIEMFSGMSMKEVKEKAAAERKKYNSPDTEIFPGMTKKEVEAKLSSQENIGLKVSELVPGLTEEGLEANMAAARAKYNSPDTEIFPGMSLAKIQARMAAAPKPDPKAMMKEMFPRNKPQ
jgi:hypothetical protein